MSSRPSALLYAVNEKPPLVVNFLLGIQHVCFLFISMVFPVLIIGMLGSAVSTEAAHSFICLSMVSGGLTTMIQASRKYRIGSGYLCPSLCGPAYFDASMMAALTGGLPLVYGMTMLGGVIEGLLSRVMNKLRFLFPVEVTGLIVAMVGIVMLPISMKSFFGIGQGDPISQQEEVITGVLTLSIMIALNVWSRGKLKLFCTLIGMIAGYLLSWVFGIIPDAAITKLANADLIALPDITHISYSFDFTYIIPFTVATICSTLKTVGDIVTCQKVNDTTWKRPDMTNVSRGILADGLGGIIPGLLGGYGQSTSSSNVGLSIATGSTSRYIAYSIGLIYIVLAFFPKLAEVFLMMPKPVIGAALIFSISFMVTTGFQMMMSRMLDARKIFIIGSSLLFGLSVDMLPHLFAGVHHWLKPIFSSSMSLSAIMAITLNFIFRLGVSKNKSIEIDLAHHNSDIVSDFMEKIGGLWGARRDIIVNAIGAINETVELIHGMELVETNKIQLVASYDELNLAVSMSYLGKDIKITDKKPSKNDWLIEDNTELAGFFIYRFTDSIKTNFENGKVTISYNFQ